MKKGQGETAGSFVHERGADPAGQAVGGRPGEIAIEPGTVLTEGWYGVEQLGGRSVRWTRPRFAWRSPRKPIARVVLSCRLPPQPQPSAIEGVLEREGAELARFSMAPGLDRLTLDLREPVAGGDFVVRLDRGFVPAREGLGPDVRELGLLVSSIDAPPARAAVPLPPPSADAGRRRGEVAPEHFLAFEERFRGSRDLILERQRRYVRYFQASWNVLDIGCGRGEFLELLQEVGSDGWGVDNNPVAVLVCVARGLRAIEADAIAYLETVEEGTLDGIFCAQVVEHLSRPELLDLLHLARRALRPGGRALFETVNPHCLTVFSDSFYVDPGHVRPVPPELLSFDLEAAGFEILETIYGSPVDEHKRLPPAPPTGSAPLDAALESWRERLNNLLYSDRDYAVLVRRPE